MKWNDRKSNGWQFRLQKSLVLHTVYFSVSFNNVFSQEQEALSLDNEEFFKQISSILLNTTSETNKNAAEVTLERFFPTWGVDRFTEEDRAEVRKLIETMRSRKMKAFPYLHDYIYALTLLGESQLSSEAIIAWHLYAEELLTIKQSAPFGKLLDFTREFFEDEILNSRGTFSWYYRRANYTFDLDTTLIIRFEYLDLVCASKNDSSVIANTSGSFNYESKTWNGENGVLELGSIRRGRRGTDLCRFSGIFNRFKRNQLSN